VKGMHLSCDYLLPKCFILKRQIIAPLHSLCAGEDGDSSKEWLELLRILERSVLPFLHSSTYDRYHFF
jgi:hypothetical protein